MAGVVALSGLVAGSGSGGGVGGGSGAAPGWGAAVDPVGLGLCGLLAVCWGGYVVVGSRLSERAPGGSGLALGLAFAALCLLPFGIADSGRALIDPRLLILGLAVAVLSSVVPYSAEMAALRRLPAGVFAVLLSLEPAIAAAVGAVLLGEVLTWVQFAGVACVVGASIGATWQAARRPTGPV